jgi:hypothetical protein
MLRQAVMKEFKDNNTSLFQDIMKCIEVAASKDTDKARFFKSNYEEYLLKGIQENLP